ncbi:TPA: AIR synthase [Candidatus Bathyarchaeota archaeon]|nr:AIR synthase [Candidatus Bathyarchaeota archaeon]
MRGARELPRLGKLPPDVFDEVIFPHLGARDDSVVVRPRHGVDFGVIEIGERALIVTTDPVFIVPEYGWERSAWFAVHILASDAAVSGVRPRYMAIDLNLPVRMTREEVEIVWTTMHRECEKIGISIAAGHTGRYDGCNYPMVGGAVVMGLTDKDGYVTPEMAEPGNKLIVTKGPAIETTGILSVLFPGLLREEFGSSFVERAQRVFYQQTVVEDALTASSVGIREDGVTAMHDATECGLWGGLYEVARASQVGMVIEQGKIPVLDEVEKVCAFFRRLTGVDIDPFKSISEGTLIITAQARKAGGVVSALRRRGIKSAIVGDVVRRGEGIVVLKPDGTEERLEHPREDPFWATLAHLLAR